MENKRTMPIRKITENVTCKEYMLEFCQVNGKIFFKFRFIHTKKSGIYVQFLSLVNR
jgi:hypothetical protein